MKKVYIIAEAGVNHNGSLDLALKLIDEAAWAGADAIKFQTLCIEQSVSKHAKLAKYQEANTKSSASQIELLKNLQLDLNQHITLQKHAAFKGIDFLSSPFDIASIKLLEKLKLETFKIPSGELTNKPYLRYLGKLNKNLIVSTGMCDMTEVSKAIELLLSSGTQKQKLCILQANTQYPTPYEDANLLAMQNMGKSLGLSYGLSDHTLGSEVALGAVALGACVIEKHITLDTSMKGPDHKASANPQQFASMIRQIRNLELALGDGVKRASKSELENKEIARKVLVACKDIKKGELFTEQNLGCKRAGKGISPMEIDELLGSKALKNYKEDEII